jgi:endonuclease/exonuclease/phosphatase family metal-dependent hydrolase
VATIISKAFRLSGLDPVFFVSHLLFLGLTYTIYLAPHIAPSTFPYFGFIPIIYPVLVLINLILIVILFWRRIPFAFLFLVLSIGLYKPLSRTYQYFGKEITAKPDLKIITLNGHGFRENGYLEFFAKEKPDVLLLQEVYWKKKQFKTLKDSIFTGYYHEKNSIIQVLSKYPIVEFQRIFSGENGTSGCAAYADIDTGKDTIRILNVYLEPMFLDKKLITESTDTEKAEENSKIIKNKLVKGFLRHENQIKQILPYIYNSKHPVILGGDLNSVPNSYEYQQLMYYLNDAYFSVGKSSGTSFHEFKYPIRIDYLLNSKEILPVKTEVLRKTKISDHYPVAGYFKLP